MKKLKVAILGQGRSGWKIHGAAMLKAPDKFETAAIVDPIESRRQKAAVRYGKNIDVYKDYREMLGRDDIDLVINATPSHLHVEITKDLLEHGFCVLCDKPVASKSADVRMLIETAKENNVGFYVFQQSRFAAYFTEIRRIIDSGVLGEIIQVSISFNGFSRRWDWQTVQAFNGGNLLNTGPHPVDQALQLYGEGVPQVKCFMNRVNTFGDAEDYVKLILWGPGKPVIDLEISSCKAYNPFLYNIQGSRGGLSATAEKINYKYFRLDECQPQKLMKEPLEDEMGEPAYCFETLKWHEEEWTFEAEKFGTFADMTGKYYDMLHGHITEGKELTVTAGQVEKQIRVIEECHRQNPMDRFA
ncbi:MAG: Gfo/Idh/MocA family oxidoreductase [Clostridia bacterium]|nr:Gfo/Idh/MocA family oxidoreductase [Clostridia bacterium]